MKRKLFLLKLRKPPPLAMVVYLAIRNASKKWTMPIRDWGRALNQFAVEFGKERVPF